MNLRIGKALVVDGDERTRAAANSLLLTSAGQPFDYASSLVEAVELLKRNNYVGIFSASELPAIPGETPRRQDFENLLDKADQLKGVWKPPFVCLYTRPADMDDDNWTCWTTNMTLKGVVKWVKKPFPSSGRTPDRMLEKILNGQYIRLIRAVPLTPAELMAAPPQVEHGVRADACHGCAVAGGGGARIMPQGGLPEMDGPAVTAKLKKVLASKGCGKDDLLSSLGRGVVGLSPEVPMPTPAAAADVPTPEGKPLSRPEGRWAGIPNEPVEIVDFMARFCEPGTKKNHMWRKRALLGAARHKTVTLPPQAAQHKNGQANHYFIHDLLSAWQGYLDKGVDLPPLSSKYLVT